MQYLSKTLLACRLVILTGPFSFMTWAQDYVDVEAERAAQSSTPGAAADPYGARPAQAYPATSYGVSSAPAGAAVAAAPGAPVGGQAQPGQNLGNLFFQIQQLQQEVMRLNGKVEEQANELRKLKEQSLKRYVDLDKRLSAGAVGASVATASASSGGNATAVAAPVSGRPNVSEQAGEGDAYRAAYALVKSQQFDGAVKAFQQFLRDYPDGKYAPNAHYWLGELYLVVKPQDLESSRQSFALLLDQYPDNKKAPDAMYKLGKVYYLKGNSVKAREYMDRVIRDYGSTNSSAVKLARDFIAQNY